MFFFGEISFYFRDKCKYPKSVEIAIWGAQLLRAGFEFKASRAKTDYSTVF